SPNTPGLRDLQRTEALRPVLSAVRAALDEVSERRVPLLVKIAPDLADADVEAVADLALELELDGIVATNTTISREGLASPADTVSACGAGGLSGAPVKRRALEVLALLHKRTGRKLCLIGVGGIENADDAFDRIAHGATLLQLYTAFIYEGPLAAYRIHRGLAERMRREGYASIEALVGSAV
ncbi:MAG: dihydroorotate dehydrogenase (quinone), partial [Polyangiaceae bacterium]|nr:dihydroorotate dehydrogenase (quinone) [Polyangiaceae bacterium]